MIRVFRVAVPTSVAVLLLSELALLTLCYTAAAYLSFGVDPSVYLLYEGGLGRLLVVVVAIMMGLHFLDLYADIIMTSRVGLVLEIGAAIGVAWIVEAVLAYLNQDWMLSRRVLLWGSVLALVSLTAWRILYEALFTRAFVTERVLFVGTNPVVDQVAQEIERRRELGLINLGYVEDRFEPGTVFSGAKVHGPFRDLTEIARRLRPDRIVVGMTERRARLPMLELLDLRFAGTLIEDAAATYETICGRVCTKELRPAQLVFSGELGPKRSSVMLQSLYAPALALVGLIVVSPVMLLAALAVRVSSRGPIFYRQTRVGLRGKPFTVFKFRSMKDRAEASTGAVWATENDPRITRVGRWLRLLRIDELPQLWNVVRGEMSIVGPRPERPEFVKVLCERIPYYRQRHCVKPGITGWAQINYGYGDSVEDTIAKLEYDLYYIKRISLSLDLYIMFHTAKTMLKLRGAQ